MAKVLIRKNLNRWFKEKWVDVSRKDKDGKHPPCGRGKASKSSKGYPKCRPSVKVTSKTPKTSGSMSEGQKRSATKRKRSKKQGVGGKPTIVKGVLVKALPLSSSLSEEQQEMYNEYDFMKATENNPMYASVLGQHALNIVRQKGKSVKEAVEDAYLDLERGVSNSGQNLHRYNPTYFAQFYDAVNNAVKNNSDVVYFNEEHEAALKGFISQMKEYTNALGDGTSSVHDLPTKDVVNHHLQNHLQDAHKFRISSRMKQARNEGDKTVPLEMFGLPSEFGTGPAIESNRKAYGTDRKQTKPTTPTHLRQLLDSEGKPYQHVLMSGEEPLASIAGKPDIDNRLKIGYGKTRPDMKRQGYYSKLMNALIQAGYFVHSNNRNEQFSHPAHLKFQERLPPNVALYTGNSGIKDKYSRRFGSGTSETFQYQKTPDIAAMEKLLGRPLNEDEFVDYFKDYGAYPIEQIEGLGAKYDIDLAANSGKAFNTRLANEIKDRNETKRRMRLGRGKQTQLTDMTPSFMAGLTPLGENYHYPFQPYDFDAQERMEQRPPDTDRMIAILSRMPNLVGDVGVQAKPSFFNDSLKNTSNLHGRIQTIVQHLSDALKEHRGDRHSVLDTDTTDYEFHNEFSRQSRLGMGRTRQKESVFDISKIGKFIAQQAGIPQTDDYSKHRQIVEKLIFQAIKGQGYFESVVPERDHHDADYGVFDAQDRRNLVASFKTPEAFVNAYANAAKELNLHPQNITPESKPEPTLQDKGFKVVPPKNMIGVSENANKIPLPDPTSHSLPEWFEERHIFGDDLIEDLSNADNPITVDWYGTPTRIDDKELARHLEGGEGYLVRHPHKNEYKVLYWENLSTYNQERGRLEGEHRRQEGRDEMNEMIGVTSPRGSDTPQPVLTGTNHIPNFRMANTVDMDTLDIYRADYPELKVDWYGVPTKMGDERLQEHLRSGDAMLHAQPDADNFHVVHNQQIAQQPNQNTPPSFSWNSEEQEWESSTPVQQQTPPALYQQNY